MDRGVRYRPTFGRVRCWPTTHMCLENVGSDDNYNHFLAPLLDRCTTGTLYTLSAIYTFTTAANQMRICRVVRSEIS